jgi:uncharacterized protein YoxC
MPNIDNQTVMLVIAAVTALAVLFQAIALLAIFLSVRKAASSVKEEVDDIRSSLMPVLIRTSEFLERVAPNVETTMVDVAAVARGLRTQTVHLEVTADEVLERVRKQGARVDAMFSTVLDGVDRASGFLADAISKPARQIAGLLASAKAIIESLRASEAAPRRPGPPNDAGPMF